MVNRIAAAKLAADMPAFFRNASNRLSFLGPEPDRWRDNRQLFSTLREFNGPDHFIDIDDPQAFRSLPNDRYQYSDWLRSRGQNPKDIGFLPYACMEYWERIQILFRLWRDPQHAAEREEIEQNIIQYAGILGHYVADGANPLHTTIHYNGWSTSLNPERYTREPLHYRFESEFVKSQIRVSDIEPLVQTAKRLQDPFAEFVEYLLASYQKVPQVYDMDKGSRWDGANRNQDSKKFVAESLARGSQMLANLWYTAWRDSATPPSGTR